MHARPQLRLLGVLLAVALLAWPAAAQRNAEPKTAGQKKAVPEVFFCQTDRTDCRTNIASFELQKVRDVFVFATWPGLSGDHVQAVEFFLPDGNLYARKETAFLVRSGVARARRPAGSKLPEHYFTASRGVPAVVTGLPVAGTFITQRALAGVWTVRVSLDGRPVTTAQFTLQVPAAK